MSDKPRSKRKAKGKRTSSGTHVETPIGSPLEDGSKSLEWGQPKLDEVHTESELMTLLEDAFEKSPPTSADVIEELSDQGKVGSGEPSSSEANLTIKKEEETPEIDQGVREVDGGDLDKSGRGRKKSCDRTKKRANGRSGSGSGRQGQSGQNRGRGAGIGGSFEKSRQGGSGFVPGRKRGDSSGSENRFPLRQPSDEADQGSSGSGRSAAMENEPPKGYLESALTSEISSAFSRAVVSLYEEDKKPENPLAYIVHEMGYGIEGTAAVEKIQEEIEGLRKQIEDSLKKNEELGNLVLELECKKVEEEILAGGGTLGEVEMTEDWREELKKYERDIEEATSKTAKHSR